MYTVSTRNGTSNSIDTFRCGGIFDDSLIANFAESASERILNIVFFSGKGMFHICN